ncbi:hypothetical protein T484DRAFT_1946184 [Baffinella frigidus]|nr:hypothetical protein T484DRAFT_1946184 [Cryptophyta sp. CCMP2293]
MRHRRAQLGSILLRIATCFDSGVFAPVSMRTAFSPPSPCAIGKAQFAAKLAARQASHAPPSVHRTLRLRGAGLGERPSSSAGSVEAQASTVPDGPSPAMQWRFKHDNQWLEYGAQASQVLEEALSAGNMPASLTLESTSTAALVPGLCEYTVHREEPGGGFYQENVGSGHKRAVRRAPACEFLRPLAPELLAQDFLPMAQAVLDTGETIQLNGGTYSLRDELTIETGQSLTIRGPGRIVGDGHSLFKVRGLRAFLNVEDKLACFGIWLVQRAIATARSCRFSDCGRSAIVAFGRPRLSLQDCDITDAGVHGVCARGGSRVVVDASRIQNCGQRGFFAYHNATLELRGTSISGTRDPRFSAVQVEALGPADHATLTMDAFCTFSDNQGADLTVTGDVTCSDAVARYLGESTHALGESQESKDAPAESQESKDAFAESQESKDALAESQESKDAVR